ncbi:MAG: enoyl-CoA hydratase-related protein [Parasphingorhabdus sp.]
MTQVSTKDMGAIRIATINNPPRGYMNAETATELCDILDAAESDKNINTLVFTGGIEGVFIRHYDVSEIVAVAEGFRGGDIKPGGDRSASPVYRLFDRMIVTPLATIAAINGTCMGGGFEFALTCDIRIAEKGDYQIGLPETRLGIIPGVGGLQLLSRVIGLSRAREMVMRGRVVGPQEALHLGILHELTEATVIDTAIEVAQEVAEQSPVAIASVKRMASEIASGESLDQGLQTAEREFSRCLLEGDAAMVKMQAFLDGGEDITAV